MLREQVAGYRRSVLRAAGRSGTAERDDHVGRSSGQDLLPGLESLGNPLRTEAGVLHGAVREAHGHVIVGEPVKAEGLHLQDDDLLLAEHRGEDTR
jgi:hypothetical protein